MITPSTSRHIIERSLAVDGVVNLDLELSVNTHAGRLKFSLPWPTTVEGTGALLPPLLRQWTDTASSSK